MTASVKRFWVSVQLHGGHIINKKSFSQSTQRAQRNAEGFPDAYFF